MVKIKFVIFWKLFTEDMVDDDELSRFFAGPGHIACHSSHRQIIDFHQFTTNGTAPAARPYLRPVSRLLQHERKWVTMLDLLYEAMSCLT